MRFSEARASCVPMLAGAAAAVLVWIVTARYGAGLTPDSVAYVSVARSLLAGEGFTLWTGAPLIDWPPLYPILLALPGALAGVDPLEASRPVQAGLAFLVVVLSWRLFARHLTASMPLLFLATAAVVISPPLLKVSRMAWSEPLFLVFVLGTVLALEEYVAAPRRSALLAAAVCTALACLTRYVGVTLVLAGGVVLLVRHRREWREALWAGLVFGTIAVWPLSLWLVRNVSLTGLPLGARHASDTTLVEALTLTAGTFGNWFFGAAPVRGALFAGGSALLVLTALALARARPARPAGRETPSLLPLALVTVAYVVVLIHSAVRTAFDPIGHRLLAPVQPLLLVAAFAGVSALAAPLAPLTPRVPLRAAAPWLLAAWLTVPAVLLARDLEEWTRDGAGGFSQSFWRDSTTLAAIRSEPRLRQRPVYSNAPDICYVLAGIPASLAPTRAWFGGGGGGLAVPEGCWPESDGWLVWFDRMKRGYVLPPAELATRARLEPVRRLSDGTLYALSARSPESCPPALAGRAGRPSG